MSSFRRGSHDRSAQTVQLVLPRNWVEAPTPSESRQRASPPRQWQLHGGQLREATVADGSAAPVQTVTERSGAQLTARGFAFRRRPTATAATRTQTVIASPRGARAGAASSGSTRSNHLRSEVALTSMGTFSAVEGVRWLLRTCCLGDFARALLNFDWRASLDDGMNWQKTRHQNPTRCRNLRSSRSTKEFAEHCIDDDATCTGSKLTNRNS